MTGLFVLDVPENLGVVRVAGADDSLRIDRVGPYFRITGEEDIVIDRRATGCRHAVWYSCVAGVLEGRKQQHDKDALRIAPR